MTDTEHNLETTETPSQSDENIANLETPPEVENAHASEIVEAEASQSDETAGEMEAEEVPVDEVSEVSVAPEDSASDEVEQIALEGSANDTESPNPASHDPIDENNESVAAENVKETVEEIQPRTKEGMNWFVLRVASNKEDYVRAALEKKVQIEGVQHLVGNIMVPTEKTKTLTKSNKVKITETKLYPGYIFVEMKLVDSRISQDVFFLIKETTGVGDFVGTAGKPTPMSDDEVDKMLFDSQAPEEVTEVKLEFVKGDHVNVKEGPFMGYEGTVDEIYPEKGVVRLLATVFGRQTQIDIEYWMIEKAE